jgi:hypothetical protein
MRRTDHLGPSPHALILALAALALSGCASLMQPTAAPTAAAAPSAVAPAAALAPAPGASRPTTGAPAATQPAPTPTPGQPPAFAVVIKDATRTDGVLPLWRKDDKVWLEIPPALFDKPLMFSVNVSHALGERGLSGGTMGPNWLVSFVKVGSAQIQLQALNSEYIASGAAQKVALAQNFSRSLLASTTVASAPHPESKAVLVDASFLLADVASYGRALEATFRLPYSPDRANSHIRQAYANAEGTTVTTSVHFAIPRLPVPPLVPSPVPLPSPPATLPDARSMLIGFVYNFSKLPEQPMAVRKADGRLGHFFDTVIDFSSDRNVRQRVHYINRWRLEKKDPQAELSEPVKPITFWLDKNIPLEYRATVMAGVLEWNRAFEKIGFKNAIVAMQQPDDADWDTLDGQHASLRWYFGIDSGSASGPSHSDPRTGEILDADIKIGDGWGRYLRDLAVEQMGGTGHSGQDDPATHWHGGSRAKHDAYCNYASEAIHELDFALETLYALGEIGPDSPQAEAFVQAVLKEVVMHEVGHTLGLKHNFKASTAYSLAQLRNPAFTEANGIGNSVMDYNAYNLPLPGERPSGLFNRTIGPYDYWAIEYAYRPLAAQDEAEALERIASRSSDPLLVFADDGDAGGVGGIEGFDPLANRFDLGSEPLEFFDRRLQLTRELWRRAAEWKPRPGEGALRQRRMLNVGFSQLSNSALLVAKYVGGLHTVREVPGTPAAAGRPASFVPTDAARQRRALDTLAKGLFSADSFRFAPSFVANLAPDYVEWGGRAPVSIPAAVLRVQAGALDRLLSPSTAGRLLDQRLYQATSANGSRHISLADVYGTLQGSIWSELKGGGEIDPLRRNLQREHLRRVQATLLRSTTPLPPDALSLMRLQATRLQTELRVAAARPGLSIETRAHLEDSLSGLSEALRASMLRS